MGFKPRFKKAPCKQCEGTGRISCHWAAGGGRIGYRSWWEPCPSCRMRQMVVEMLTGVERVKFTIKHMKGAPIEEKYRYEIEGEVWNEKLKRYDRELKGE